MYNSNKLFITIFLYTFYIKENVYKIFNKVYNNLFLIKKIKKVT
jgi:hypothetical protein